MAVKLYVRRQILGWLTTVIQATGFCLPQKTGSCKGNSWTLRPHTLAGADTFRAIDVGTYAAPFAVDWDGDGDLDLLVGNYHGRVSYFERLADSTLVLRQGAAMDPFHAIGVGTYAAPCAVDWDGDGDLDLLVGSYAGGVSYFERLSDSTLVLRQGAAMDPFKQFTDQVISRLYFAPFAVDWDGDGDLDLFLGTSRGRIEYFERLSDSTLALHQETGMQGPIPFMDVGDANGNVYPFAVDWDGDGDLDLIVGTYKFDDYGGVLYFERLADSTLVRRQGPTADPFHAISFIGLGDRAFPCAVDWDGDGDLDLLVGNALGRVEYFEDTKDTTLVSRHGSPADPFHNIDVGAAAFPCAVDWDGDGDLDLLVGTVHGSVKYFERVQGSTLVLREGWRNDPFALVDVSPSLFSPASARPFAVDWDGDGDLDLLVGTITGHVKYFERLHNSTFVAAHVLALREGPAMDPFHAINVGTHAAPFAVDWDGDGDLDLLVGNMTGHIKYFERLHDSTLVLREGAAADPFHAIDVGSDVGGFSSFPSPFAVDWDGDGDLDLLVGRTLWIGNVTSWKGHVMYFERLHDSTLVLREGAAADPFHAIVDVGMFPIPFAADWDGDGDVDLLVGNSYGQIFYFEHGACSLISECSNRGMCDLFSGRCECLVGHATHDCSTCEAGYYPGIDTRCLECPPGKFSGIGSQACSRCEVNHYSPAKSGQCFVCPSGKKAMNYRDGCVDCPNNTHSISIGWCKECPAGYIPTSDGGNCVPCPGGTVPAGDGTCTSCAAGTAAASGDSVCTPCMPGTYAKAAFDFCKPCPSDFIAAAEGSDSCEACSFGFVPSAGGSSCGLGPALVVVCILIPAIVLAAVVGWGIQRCRHRHARFALLVAVQTRNVGKLRKAIQQGTKRSVDKTLLHEAQNILDMCLHKYVDPRFLLNVLAEGDLKFLKGSWLADREEGWRLQRQQDLPEEAFWKAEELEAEQRCVLFVAISYCWLHPVHPDPESKHFRTLHRALRLRLQVKGIGQVEDIALFLDYCSMPQQGERGDPSDPEPVYARDSAEKASFGRALKQVNLAYANQSVEVWMMKWVPEEQPRKYITRGWPFFEQAVAGLITDSTKLLTVEPETQQCRTWSDLFDGAVLGRCPPMTPDEFEQEIRSKTFTNGKTDSDFVVHKYAETFDEVVGNANMLWFTNLKWTDEDAKELVKLLPCCKHVRGIYLGLNNITAEGAMALVKAAKDCPTLLTMDLSRNSIPVSEEAAIRRQWEKSGKSPIKLRMGGLNLRRPSVTTDQPIAVGI